MLALKIILVIVLVLLLLVAVGVWWLINKLKGVVSAVKEGLSQMQIHPPCRVNPVPEPNPKWNHPEQIKQFSAEFEANGFTPLGAFRIPEIIGMQFAAFANEAESLYGAIYDHVKLPPSLDAVCAFEDGTELTVGNSTFGDAMDRPPDSPAIRLNGGGVAEVLAALANHPAASPRIPIKGGEFADRFKASYAKEMNWRLKRGGATREELRRQAAKSDKQLTEEEFEEFCLEYRTGYMMELQRACTQQYQEEQGPTAAGESPDLLAIPETMTAAEVHEMIEIHSNLDESKTDRMKQFQIQPGQSALNLMQQIVDAGFAPGLQRAGAVREPVAAEIYLIQATAEEDED